MTVEPRAALVIELSCRQPERFAASALAAETVYVPEATTGTIEGKLAGVTFVVNVTVVPMLASESK